MSEDVVLHVITSAQLRADDYRAEWDDPEKILEIGPRARRMLLDTPLSRGEGEPVQIAALLGARVVGRLQLLGGELRANGQSVPVIWGSGLLVSPAARGKGVGKQLVNKWRGLHHTCAGCGTAQVAQIIYRKLEWTEFAFPRHILLRRSRSVLDKLLGRRRGAAILAPLVDLALAMQRLVIGMYTSVRARGLRVETAERLSPEFDEVLSSQDKPVVSHRSAAWINWLLDSSDESERRGQRLCYVRDRRGRVVAYFLIRRRFHETASSEGYANVMLGSLKDWGIIDAARVDVLTVMLLALRELLRWRLDAAEICVTDQADGRVLRRLGLARKGNLYIVLNTAADSPLADPTFHKQANWRLTAAEGDNFYN